MKFACLVPMITDSLSRAEVEGVRHCRNGMYSKAQRSRVTYSSCNPSIMRGWWETNQKLKLQAMPEYRVEQNYPKQ